MFAITSFCIVETIGVNDEEVFFTIENEAQYEHNNYSYPAYYPFESLKQNSTAYIYKNITKSQIYWHGMVDLFRDNAIFSQYNFTVNSNMQNDSLLEFNESCYRTYYNDEYFNTGGFRADFEIGLYLESYSQGRIFTFAEHSNSSEIFHLESNNTHFNWYRNSTLLANIAHYNQSSYVKLYSNRVNWFISINNTYDEIFTLNWEYDYTFANFMVLGAFANYSSAIMNITQFNANIQSSIEYDIYIPLNPFPEQLEISSVLVNDILCYESLVFTFNTTEISSEFNFAALFSNSIECYILFSYDLIKSSLTPDYREIGKLKRAVVSVFEGVEYFNLINISQSLIEYYNNEVENENIEKDFSGIPYMNFTEITFIFENITLLKGWSSNYEFRISNADVIHTNAFNAFGLFNSQPFERVDEFFEPVAGLLDSTLFAYYGSVQYPTSVQLYEPNVFICDGMALNSRIYLKNDSEYIFVISGIVGKAYINYDSEQNQTRSYYRIVFSRLDYLYKAQLTFYDLEQNVATSRIIQSLYPIQLEFVYDNVSNTIECLNYVDFLFTMHSNQSISLMNEQACGWVVLNEHPNEQTWSTSNYIRKLISIQLTKDFDSSSVSNTTVFEKLLDVEATLSIESSLINSANTYDNIGSILNSNELSLTQKLGTTFGFILNYKKVLTSIIHSHLDTQLNPLEFQPKASGLFDTSTLGGYLIDTFLPYVAPITALGIAAITYSGEEERGEEHTFGDRNPITTWSEAQDELEQLFDITINLGLDGIFDTLTTLLTDSLNSFINSVVPAIENMLLYAIETVSEIFYTLTENLMQDFVNFNSAFENYEPDSNELSVLFLSSAFIDENTNQFSVILSSTWLLGNVVENHTVLSFLIELGVSVLMFFILPAFVHIIKRKPILTYLSMIISAFVLIISSLMNLGMGLLSIVVSALLLVRKVKEGNDSL